MTKDEMLTAISQIQAMTLSVTQDRDDAYGMYWQAADLAWALMQATGIAAVTREQFKEKQEQLFDAGWALANRKTTLKEALDRYLAEDWPEVLE